MNDLAIHSPNFSISETGIAFTGELDFNEWNDLGRRLARAGRCVAFAIGDWINYGEKRYGGKYEQAIAQLGLEHQTLQNYAWVARSISCDLRRFALDKISPRGEFQVRPLSYDHFRLVSKLPAEDQKRWLEAAQRHQMSTRRLRKSLIVGRVLSVDEMQDDPADKPQLTYPVWINRLCQWWRQRIADEPLEQWEPEDRAALKRDLQPIIDIANEL